MIDLKKKRAFLFDIDGTISVGDRLYDGSRALLEYIAEIRGKAYFITNNSTLSTKSYIEKFAKWNIRTEESQFVTAGSVSIDYLRAKHASDKIFVIAASSYLEELKKNGLHVTEQAEADVGAVLVAFDNELRYEKLFNACKILSQRDIPFLATNPDLCCPAPFGFIPDCGSICMMIENAVNKKPKYLGKPDPCVVEACLADGGFGKDEAIVFGDRLYTDIACGRNAGVDTVAFLTGETNPEEIARSEIKPDLVYPDIRTFTDILTAKDWS